MYYSSKVRRTLPVGPDHHAPGPAGQAAPASAESNDLTCSVIYSLIACRVLFVPHPPHNDILPPQKPDSGPALYAPPRHSKLYPRHSSLGTLLLTIITYTVNSPVAIVLRLRLHIKELG